MTLITFNYPQIINAGLTVTNISLYIIIRVFMYMTKKKPNKKIKMWSDISTYSFCHVRYSTCNAEPSLKMKLSAIFDLLRLSEGAAHQAFWGYTVMIGSHENKKSPDIWQTEKGSYHLN
jgi:predicted SnoaL-like aldol condensation-catalyzing enzyme